MLEKIGQEHHLEVRGVIYLETDAKTILKRIQSRAEETSRQDDQDQNVIQQRIDEQKNN